MSISIKVSELSVLNQITNDDYIVLNDSGSTTTMRATFDTLSTWLTGSARRVGSASYAIYAYSASYASSASWADFAAFASSSLSASNASRSLYTTYVLPTEPLAVGYVNMVGTASWAATASNLTYLHDGIIPWNILASSSMSASYIEYNDLPNGTSSYAMKALRAVTADALTGGGGLIGNGTLGILSKWSSTGTNQPLIDSKIWEGTNFASNPLTLISSDPISSGLIHHLQTKNITGEPASRNISLISLGGNILVTGSGGKFLPGNSPNISFFDYGATYWTYTGVPVGQPFYMGCRIYLSGSAYERIGGAGIDENMILETFANGLERFIFRTYIADPAVKGDNYPLDHTDMFTITNWVNFCHANLNGYMYINPTYGPSTYYGTWDYYRWDRIPASEEVHGKAKLHISGSLYDPSPMLTTEIIGDGGAVYTGLYVDSKGKVGVNCKTPMSKLDVLGSIASTGYWIRDPDNTGKYYKGIDGVYGVYATDTLNQTTKRYLTFKNGLLVGESVTPPASFTPHPLVNPPVTETITYEWESPYKHTIF